jgi:ketosteroid isomerase-like protein
VVRVAAEPSAALKGRMTNELGVLKNGDRTCVRARSILRKSHVEAYAPDAVIFDLTPPLRRRGMIRDNGAAWFAGWDGPIQIDAVDVSFTVDGDLAFVSTLNRMRGRQGGEDQDLLYRTTMCIQKINRQWKIVCDHSSVPFYMVGS